MSKKPRGYRIFLKISFYRNAIRSWYAITKQFGLVFATQKKFKKTLQI